jgi:4-hydroxybenzoate polyprenyltransferase
MISGLFSTPLRTAGLFLRFWTQKALLKEKLGQMNLPEPATLPYREEVLDFIQAHKKNGGKVFLVTAATERHAHAVASHLQIFDGVLCSTSSRNLKGTAKAETLCEEFGAGQFHYIGDSTADLAVWSKAAGKYLVESKPGIQTDLRAEIPELITIVPYSNLRTRTHSLLRALRTHQWVKNLLLFLPLFLAHQVSQPLLFVYAALGFIAFSFCASAVYLLNDLVDLNSDRQHPIKRKRPLAAGGISLLTAITLIPLLIGVGLVLAALVSSHLVVSMLTYLVLTTAYSFFLKRVVVLDIVTLSLLYTLRIVAGGIATEVAVSQWLLGFSLFFFFSLAAVKRYEELLTAEKRGNEMARGRGYFVEDKTPVSILGIASGIVSVMILALYINSPDVTHLYQTPKILLCLCPPLLYWISRIWILTFRGEMHADPIVFAIRDRVSYVVGLLSVLVLIAASYTHSP